jgi:hypothetical protein
VWQVRDLFRFANVLDGRVDEVFAGALLLAFLGIAREREAAPRTLWSYRMPLLAAGLTFAYLLAPASAGYVAYIHYRAVPFILVFVLASPWVARSSPKVARLAGVAVVLQLAYAGYLVTRYRAFEREADLPALTSVLDAAPPGQRVLSLMLHRRSKVIHFEPYLHFGLYYQVLRGGRTRFNFGELPWMPARFHGAAREYPWHWEFDAGRFDWPSALGDADYVLLRTCPPDGEAADDPEPGGDFGAGWELLAHAGRWELFAPAHGATSLQGRAPPRRSGPLQAAGATDAR